VAGYTSYKYTTKNATLQGKCDTLCATLSTFDQH